MLLQDCVGVRASLWVSVLALAASSAGADVFHMPSGQASLEFVTVGDAGNAPDTRVMISDGTSGYGAVPYVYQMGKFDVTARQYAQFLNAVAATDSYGLYNTRMASTSLIGCGISRSGTAGSYTYSVTRNPDFPANYVSWASAARFANWLANGQPTGLQASGITETGSYDLSGTHAFYDANGRPLAGVDAALAAVVRSPGATYVIPSEDEWYKAAYYKGGGTDVGYWKYPTRSDTAPSNVLSSTGTNNANYAADGYGYTDPANYLTSVGYFAGSPGPYGTFDQGGDVSQWHEGIQHNAITGYYYRGNRGGSFHGDSFGAGFRNFSYPTGEDEWLGFRVAVVPDPVTLSLFAVALGGGLLRRARSAA